MNAQAMMNKIKDGQLDDAFRRVYVTDGEVAKQKSRYMELLTTFAETFGGPGSAPDVRSRTHGDLR